jgi:predicted RNase H-like nuclease (RuvC/YqgF family)
MSRRRGEPVKNTCPAIDGIIETITSICKQMDRCSDEDSVTDLLENIGSWMIDLESIGFGNSCQMEDLRSANAALREWGTEMYNDAESLENERDDFERLYEEEKSKVSELEDKISDLEQELTNNKRGN